MGGLSREYGIRVLHVCGRYVCKMGLYTELFYAIIPACFLTFCCSAIPTSPYIFYVFYIITRGNRTPGSRIATGCILLDAQVAAHSNQRTCHVRTMLGTRSIESAMPGVQREDKNLLQALTTSSAR